MREGAGPWCCWRLAHSELQALSSRPFPGALIATTHLHFCKVMSSADNGFSVPGGAVVPDIALWGRDPVELIAHSSGRGGLCRPPPPLTAASEVQKAGPLSQASWSREPRMTRTARVPERSLSPSSWCRWDLRLRESRAWPKLTQHLKQNLHSHPDS